MDRLQTKIADSRVLSLIESFLKAGVMDGAEERIPVSGAPQGAVLSPLLSNVYLDPLDHLMAHCGFEMVRYADDRRGRIVSPRGLLVDVSFTSDCLAETNRPRRVILCRSAEEAERALELVRKWVTDNGLTLHPTKTQIVDSRTESFSFLGYDFLGTKHWPRKKSLQKLKDTLRTKTRRTSGDSFQWIIVDVNRTLRGWFNYFQHSTRRSVYSDLDSWLRMRLRSLLRRRAGGRGVARDQTASFTWPNAFFAAHRLFSLATAHRAARQSSRR